MREGESSSEAPDGSPDCGTLAPARPRAPVDDDDEIRQQDPYASLKGLLVLLASVVGVLVLGWGIGIFAFPGQEVGLAECRRTCAEL